MQDAANYIEARSRCLAAGAAAVLPVAAAAWPIVAPLREISQLAGMSAAQIEEAVRVKEPVQVRDR